MLIAYAYNKLKSLYPLLLPILCSGLITACNGSSNSSNNNGYSNGELSISAFVESNLLIGESTTATISIAGLTSGESAVVAINNNNSSVMLLTPHNCTLSVTVSSCTVRITALESGTATFDASSTGTTTVTSDTLTVAAVPNGILFGTQNGLVFANDTLITGNSSLATIDYSQIFGFAIDSNGNMYAGTMGATFGGFGAGKVFKYNSELGYWTILAGTGAGGSLDGSQVDFLIIDSANYLYAATSSGNIFKYANNVWSLMATTLNQPIKVLAFDANNNLYAGTNNGADVGSVFKYVNGAWVSLGSPDSTGIQSIAINSSGSIYAATAGNGGDGQVYHYTSGTSWTTISTFNDGSVNALVVNGSDLYAGTATGKVHKYAGSGTTWTLLGTPDAISASAITAMTLSDSEVYAGTTGTNGDSTNGQIYHYNGTTWDQVSNLNNGYISTIVVYNGNLYTSTANPSFMNGMVYTYVANRWSPIGTGALDGTPVYSTALSSRGNLYAGTQNNVFKYLAANKFWMLLGNLGAVDNSGVVALTTYESNVYAGTVDGNVFTTINGGSWLQIATNSNYITSGLLVSAAGQLYTSMNYNDPSDQNLKDGRVQKYNTTSGIWETLNGSAARHSVDGTPIQSITMDTTGNIYAATAGNGNGGFVWEYPVGSSAWVLLGMGTLDGTAINSVITDSNLNVYAGTSAGNVFKYNGYYWVQINTSPLDTLGVSSLTIDHEGVLSAATYGGMVWMYINNTALWVKTKYGIGVSINITGSISF